MAIARYVVLGVLFLIPFLPLYVANDLFFPFIASKGFAFRILIEIAFGAWVLLALADKRYRPQFSWTLLIYGAFVAWMLLADLVSPNPHKALWSNYERMDGWVTMIHVFLLFIVAGSVLAVEKLWKRWWMAFLGASALVAGYGLLQLMGVLDIHQGGVRLDASFGNAAYLAAYLLSAIAIALWQGMESKGWLRYGLFALAGVQFILLFATATRGAILAFVGAAVLASVLFALRSKATRKAGAVALAALALIAGAFLLAKDSTFVREDPTLSRIASISLADGDTRFTLWGMAWEGFLERPVTGWGQEGFVYVFSKHYDPSLYGQEPWFDRAHSVYVDWLSAGGFPALLLFLALLVSAIVALYRSKASAGERIMLTVALAAYAFQALFVFDNLFTYVVLAAILATAHAERSRPLPLFERMPDARSLTVGGPVVLVATALVVWFVNVPGIAGGQSLLKAFSSSEPKAAVAHFIDASESGSFASQEIAEQFAIYASSLARSPSVDDALKQEALSRGLLELQEEVARAPGDPRLRIQFASALEAGGLLAESLAETEAAIALSPNKQLLYLQRGVTRWRAGDSTGARADFDAAYALGPSFGDLAAYAAAGDLLAGDIEGARALLTQALGTTTVDHDFLRAVYFQKGMYVDLVRSSELHARTFSSDPASFFALAQAYATAGRNADARATLSYVIAHFPQSAATASQMLNALGN